MATIPGRVGSASGAEKCQSDHAVLPLVVIVGPTASGKTSLAIRLAQQCGGEIICADSRTVYRGMDIGTAKPTLEEQAMVPHWGVDLVEPSQRFTAVDFQRYAKQKIREIRHRGHIPFLVGGTGLYVDAVVYDFQFPTVNKKLMQKISGWSLTALHEYCRTNNISLPHNKYNKRHVVNTIVRNGTEVNKRKPLNEHTFIVGIATNRDILRTRIEQRADIIVSDNVVAEAIGLAERYGWDNEAMTGNIYPIIHKLQQGVITRQQARELFCRADWHLAKRQLTWLRRNPDIVWCQLDAAYDYVMGRLAQATDV